MMDLRLVQLARLAQPSYWAQRIVAQLEYASELSKIEGGQYDDLIHSVLDELEQSIAAQASLTRQAAEAAESALLPLRAVAKRYTLICVAHAHIDMNWMWRWDETVAITLDTFRTILDLMEEYPDFTFSQSQASVYQLVERYDPSMLAAIRQRVQEGRWEVSAVTWVEADKNMPAGESMARHLLYTRRYLRQLFNLPDAAFHMDYEPDTFGHSQHVPEILAQAGVRHYYHCRGDQDEWLYRWQAPSGRSILVYREPTWYLGYIEPGIARLVPGFCSRYGIDAMLKVYGVGDHGGGPTRRDLERLIDMNTWSIYPQVRFGTYRQFFEQVDEIAERLPVKTGELNFIFTGCYSSQSRIKRANRLGEAALFEAETLNALAVLQAGMQPTQEQFAQAWKHVLFNQFHDILPGSGTVDTREYALGLFQEVMAVAGSQRVNAMRRLAGVGAHSELPDRDSISEGAGVGFGLPDFRVSQVSRGQGLRRLFHVFNVAAWERHGLVEIVLWDWEGDLQRMAWRDAFGNLLSHQCLDRTWQEYWGHRYVRVLLPVSVPACSFTTVFLEEATDGIPVYQFPMDWRVERPEEIKLENEFLLARFDPSSCALIELLDKRNGSHLVSPERPAGLRYILEDDRLGMTAWTVGRYQHVQSLQNGARVLHFERGDLRQQLTYEVRWRESLIKVSVALEAGSPQLDYRIECDWLEIGRKGQGVPQLNFHLPMAFGCRAYRYDVPMGAIERPALDMDVPGVSWASAIPLQEEQSSTLMLISLGGYGFRGVEDSLALTLLRSSYDPDPYPELGRHTLRFSVRLVEAHAPASALARASFDVLHPLRPLSGNMPQPPQSSYMELQGESVLVSGVKLPEDDPSGKVVLVRLYEIDGKDTRTILRFWRQPIRAVWVDLHEQPLPEAPAVQVEDKAVVFLMRPYQIGSIEVEFE